MRQEGRGRHLFVDSVQKLNIRLQALKLHRQLERIPDEKIPDHSWSPWGKRDGGKWSEIERGDTNARVKKCVRVNRRVGRRKRTILSSLESRPAAVEITLKRFDIGDDFPRGFEGKRSALEPDVEPFYPVIIQVQQVYQAA